MSTAIWKNLSCCLLLLAIPSLCQAERHQEFAQGSIELLADKLNVVPGHSLRLGVHFTLAPGWHVYWKNPGDTGLPTRITWMLSDAVQVGNLRWPEPERIQTDEFVNFGYERETLLEARVKIPSSGLSDGSLKVESHVRWVFCKDVCIPGNAHLDLALPQVAAEREQLSVDSSRFTEEKGAMEEHTLRTTYSLGQNEMLLAPVDIPNLAQADIVFFPEKPGVFENKTLPTVLPGSPSTLRLSLQAGGKDSGLLQGQDIQGILRVTNKGGEPQFLSVLASPVALGSQVIGGRFLDFLGSLFFAFLGGLILNFMPCVFPIISLKILSFMNAGSPRKAVLHGLTFAAGVIASFWILALVLFTLRSVGVQVGWGFQFQSPIFIALMAYFIFALGLNLLGVFEVGNKVQNLAGRVPTAPGYRGSFANGALATLLATPCSAPFMASAIAAALVAPWQQGFLLLTFLGLGMSAPYIALPIFPKAMKFLPRPGAWLDGFKHLMAFPLFATVCWLATVLLQQVSQHNFSMFLFGIIPLSLALWSYGLSTRATLTGRHRVSTQAIAILLLAITWWLGVSGQPAAGGNHDGTANIATSAMASDGEAIRWQDFSKEKLDNLIKEQKAVLVDFTASWCLTCQLNHKLAFESKDVARALETKSIAALRADWTNSNPEVSAAIAAFGRASVPLTVLYAPGKAPQILPSVLTAGMVLNAFSALPGHRR